MESNIREETGTTLPVNETNSQEKKFDVDKIMKDIFEKGMLPKDAMGMSDTMMEALYAHAYRLYNAGKYEDAIQMFQLLLLFNYSEVKYSLGLAACFQMMKNYKKAAASYALANIIDPKNPMPFYHASDCYIRMNDSQAAKIALEMTIKLAGNDPLYSMIKDRSLFTLESLKKG